MNISNSLPKTFLIFGILLLGVLYVLATLITFVPITALKNDVVLEREILLHWLYIKGGIALMGCLTAIGFVLRKIWFVGKDYEGNKLWVYLAISFIVSVSVLLFLLNLILLALVLNPD